MFALLGSVPMLEEEIRRYLGVSDVIKATCPLGRVAEPEEVVDVVLIVCGSGNGCVSGTGLIVDAGLTLRLHVG